MAEFASIETALAEIRAGKLVILVDDESRENEGDLVIAAEKVTPDAINFMACEGRGLICLSMSAERMDMLEIPLQVQQNASTFGTAFGVGIEARTGVSTGISAADRARTIQVAIDPASGPEDLVRPGHVFPLRARDGGVLIRAGQTEGSVDLARLSGLSAAGVICEIMNPDGTMARRPELEEFAEKHGLVICSVEGLIAHRMQRERLIELTAKAHFPTSDAGDFEARVYRNTIDGTEVMALVKGTPEAEVPTLVRVHMAEPFGDIFGLARPGYNPYLRRVMRKMDDDGCGVVVFLKQPGGGEPDFGRWIKHFAEHDEEGSIHTPQTKSASEGLREIGIGAQILVDIGVRRLKVATSSPKRLVALHGFGLEVVEHVDLETGKAYPFEPVKSDDNIVRFEKKESEAR